MASVNYEDLLQQIDVPESAKYYKNICIKQVPDIAYWIYIIEGIKYYVTNCGFIVLNDKSYNLSDQISLFLSFK